jgi:diketogulonate reductase-like aldo/keto reductase
MDRVERLGKKYDVSIACIATAWSIAKGNIPITGLNPKDRIEEAVANSRYALSDSGVAYLDELRVPIHV